MLFWLLKNLKLALFLTSSALVTVNCREDKGVAAENKSNRPKSLVSIKEKDTCINSMEINEVLSIRCNLHKCEKGTCVNISGMNAMFDITYKSRLIVKF